MALQRAESLLSNSPKIPPAAAEYKMAIAGLQLLVSHWRKKHVKKGKMLKEWPSCTARWLC